jgi:hypothetical protein
MAQQKWLVDHRASQKIDTICWRRGWACSRSGSICQALNNSEQCRQIFATLLSLRKIRRTELPAQADQEGEPSNGTSLRVTACNM